MAAAVAVAAVGERRRRGRASGVRVLIHRVAIVHARHRRLVAAAHGVASTSGALPIARVAYIQITILVVDMMMMAGRWWWRWW